MNYSMEELLPVTAFLTKKYTMGESTSVTYETARNLMEAALYCIHMLETNGETTGLVLIKEKIPAMEAYRLGYHLLIEKIKQVQEQYNQMVLHFHGFENENYCDTVTKALPGFFRYYDPRFRPQETIITMDYPTIRPVQNVTGILAIEKYIEYISYEQKFLQAFPKEFVYQVLTADHVTYRRQFYNICGVVLRTVLRQWILLESFRPEREKEYRDRLLQWMAGHSKKEALQYMQGLLNKMIGEKYDKDTNLLSYLSCDLEDYVVRLRNTTRS
ncbi:MAG: DUF6179 domain-containing protein [Lachnospiraceae bacterium]|nr:DUF6179 domain-containing protein [Lachnospiraceae bacterium]